jgi:hypothetical protein
MASASPASLQIRNLFWGRPDIRPRAANFRKSHYQSVGHCQKYLVGRFRCRHILRPARHHRVRARRNTSNSIEKTQAFAGRDYMVTGPVRNRVSQDIQRVRGCDDKLARVWS